MERLYILRYFWQNLGVDTTMYGMHMVIQIITLKILYNVTWKTVL
jgi:hypothetical protein